MLRVAGKVLEVYSGSEFKAELDIGFDISIKVKCKIATHTLYEVSDTQKKILQKEKLNALFMSSKKTFHLIQVGPQDGTYFPVNVFIDDTGKNQNYVTSVSGQMVQYTENQLQN